MSVVDKDDSLLGHEVQTTLNDTLVEFPADGYEFLTTLDSVPQLTCWECRRSRVLHIGRFARRR